MEKEFRVVVDKVAKALEQQSITEQKVANDNNNEKVALFTGESIAYSIVYYFDKKRMIIRSCSMTEEGPDNEWKNLATWMFDPETDGNKELTSIANDFVEAVSTVNAIKRIKTTKSKKKKGDDEGNADPIFLAKRLVAIFPDLKEEIKEEDENYYPFRGVTFTKEHIVPKVKEYIAKANKTELEKFGQILSTQYSNGDVDTRSIITIVILNSIEESRWDDVNQYLSEELQKYWKGARKFIGKTVKPEKPKKKKKTIAERLQEQNQ